MKILVVSLLRIGDILMTAPALKEISEKYPGAKIDILVNRQCRSAAELLPFVSSILVFERDLYQAAMKSADRNILEPFYKLDSLIQALRDENYQIVFNFTHNRVSGYLCGALENENVVGLALDQQGHPKFGSPWFKYLNESADAGEDTFHLSDIFRFAVGSVASSSSGFEWKVSSAEKVEVQKLLSKGSHHLVIQPFSSEEKKELSISQWRLLIGEIKSRNTFDCIWILGGPNEENRSREIASNLSSESISVESVMLSLEGAAALLKGAKALLTLDTSIKHLATPYKLKIVELSLGSSDWKKVGVYSDGQIIVQSAVSCAPCMHSTPCQKSKHLCGMSFNPKAISDILHFHNSDLAKELVALASEQKESIQILRTTLTNGGYWQGIAVNTVVSGSHLELWLNKLITKLMLQGEHLESIGQVGTEAMRFGQWLRQIFPNIESEIWRDFLAGIVGETQQVHKRSQIVQAKLAELIRDEKSKRISDIGPIRNLQNKISGMDHRMEIHQRLTRTLNSIVGSAI